MKPQMKSQWDCVLQNLGDWQGSFTQLSPAGELIEEVPSLISLQGINDNRAIHLVLRRFYAANPDQPHELVMDFSTAGAGALFFESGAFSEGGIYYSTGLKFGAELGFIHQDRRLRLVQIFDSNSQCSRLTLIRERRVGSDAPERPPLSLSDWSGNWQGETTTLYPNSSDCEVLPISRADAAQAEFQQEGLTYQALCLPDGAISICPVQLAVGQAFTLEAGWLLQPNLRQRLIRRYGADGKWLSVTWTVEQR